MSVIVNTPEFLTLLKVAAVTAYNNPGEDPVLASVHLMSINRGATGRALVATTSDGVSAGQYTINADGEFDSPLLMELSSSKWLVSMLTTAMKQMGKIAGKDAEFTTRLEQVGTPAGPALRVSSLTDGVPGEADNSGVAGIMDGGEYKATEIHHDLAGVVVDQVEAPGGGPLPEGVMVPWAPQALRVASQIASLVGEPVLAYRLGHVANRRLVCCGDSWRGSLPGALYEVGEDTCVELDSPGVELVDIRPVEERGEDPAAGGGEPEAHDPLPLGGGAEDAGQAPTGAGAGSDDHTGGDAEAPDQDHHGGQAGEESPAAGPADAPTGQAREPGGDEHADGAR